MKLWLISQEVNTGCDTFDSAVVAAVSEDEARRIHPGGRSFEDWPTSQTWQAASWCRNPEDVKVRLIGFPVLGTPTGVICASYIGG